MRTAAGRRQTWLSSNGPVGNGRRHRSPRGSLPRNRAIFVEAAVSSMKISPSGSRSSWPSNQATRRRRTSGRCRYEACAVFFFKRDAAPVEEQPDRQGAARTLRSAPRSSAISASVMSGASSIRPGMYVSRVQLRTRWLALLARRRLAGLAIAVIPASRRRYPDPEAPRRLPRRNPFFDRSNHPAAKVGAQAPRQLPANRQER